MSMVFQPNIVMDGLVLLLDAANPKSYPGSGTTWYDLSGNGNHVTLQNTLDIAWNSNGYFDTGTTGYFTRTTSITGIPTGTSSYTMFSWFQKPSGRVWGDDGIISIGSFGTSYESNALRTRYSSYAHYWWSHDLNSTTHIGTGTNLSNTSIGVGGGWICIVAMFNGTNRYVYENNVLLGYDTPTNHNVTSNTITIAKTYNTEYLDGYMAYSCIWNRALTTSELTQNYNALRSRFGL